MSIKDVFLVYRKYVVYLIVQFSYLMQLSKKEFTVIPFLLLFFTVCCDPDRTVDMMISVVEYCAF
jgi:hypothetical protein